MLVLVVVVVMAEVFRGAPGLRSSLVAGQVVRGILAALIGFWVVGSSPTVVGCWSARAGTPVPVHGLRAPQVRVGETTRGGQVPG